MTGKFHATIAAIAGAMVLLWGLTWYLSPKVYASSVITAATTGDLGTLVKRMDIERIRKSAADDLTDAALAATKLPEGSVLPHALRSIITQAVRAVSANSDPVLAEKIANLVNGKGFVTQAVFSLIPKETLAKRTAEGSGAYGDTHDVFFHRLYFRETGEEISLMFERRGVLAWRLVAIKANGSSVLLPLFAGKQ